MNYKVGDKVHYHPPHADEPINTGTILGINSLDILIAWDGLGAVAHREDQFNRAVNKGFYRTIPNEPLKREDFL